MTVQLTPQQIDVLRRCRDGVEIQEAKEILEFLIDIGFCDRPSTLAQTKIYISQAGEAYLCAIDEQQQNAVEAQTQKKKDKRRDFLRQILLVLLGAVLTLLVEYLLNFVF